MRVGRGRQRRDDERHERPSPDGEPRVDGYADLTVIGHGASATVYRAAQADFGRRVALKVLNVDASNRKAQRRFTSERELNGRLSDHPNVVTVLDAGFVDGRYPFLAMEHFEHGSLADRLAELGPLDVDVVLHIGVRIAGALETAHRVGVLHRDVKPQNILLSRYGEPALADFGIATMLEIEQSLTHALTPAHAAPEILEGADPSPSADVYALGSTLYTLLAGTPPFAGPPGEGMLAQLLRITTSELPAMARSDVPESLMGVLRRATAKRPADRIATAAELGRALQAVQTELGLPVSPLPIEDHGGRSRRADTVEPTARPLAAPAADATPVVDRRPDSAPALVEPDPRDVEPATGPVTVAAFEPPGPDADMTIGQQLDAPTISARQVLERAARDGTDRRRRPIVLGALAGAGVLAVATALLLARPWSGEDSSVATTAPADSIEVEVPAGDDDGRVDAGDADLAALAPTDVTATYEPGSNGWLVGWSDRSGDGAQHVVFVYRPGQDPVTEVPARGSSSHVVLAEVGVDDPACFVVSAVVFSNGEGEPLAGTADSAPQCVNGAVAEGAPTSAPTTVP